MTSSCGVLLDLLSELSRTTTVYHDAPADLVEDARREYLEALRRFNSAQGITYFTDNSDF